MRHSFIRLTLPVVVIILAFTAAFAALPAFAATAKPAKATTTKKAPVAARAAARAKAPAPVTWTVLVGGETKGATSGWEFLKFYPGTIQVNVGDTIVFKQNSSVPHTVTFPKTGTKPPAMMIRESATNKNLIENPLAVMPQGGASYNGTALTGSGQLGGDAQHPTEYKLTFTKVGDFTYYCAFDPTMIGRVIVRKAGTRYPETQAQLDSAAKKALQADDAAVAKLAATKNLEKVVTRAGATRGTRVHIILAGWGNGKYSWMRFGPTNVNVKAGDTVEWVQADPEMSHTVTFDSGAQMPAFLLQQKNAKGQPVLVINPQVASREGGRTYSGTGYFNSGLLEGTRSRLAGPRTYSLVFSKAGKYDYISAVADQSSMQGRITVTAAQVRAATRTARTTVVRTHKVAPKVVRKHA